MFPLFLSRSVYILISNTIHFHFANSGENATTSGTTATVCLLRNSIELVLGHVGDSRALLCRNGETKKLTTDHTADLKSEKVILFAY